MSVYITYNETLTFGGTFDPAFSLTIVSFSFTRFHSPVLVEAYCSVAWTESIRN